LSIKKMDSGPNNKTSKHPVSSSCTSIGKGHAKKTIKEDLSGSSAPAGGKSKMGKIGKSIGSLTLKQALSQPPFAPAPAPAPAGGKIKMGKIGKSIGKEVGKSALRVGTDVGEQMLANYLAGEGRPDKVRQAIDDIEDLGSDIKHLVQKKRGGARSGGARSERAQIVKQVMAERGCSLPQASKIVKEEGLY